MKILLTGGGTAGHIFPIIAIIEKIRKQGIDYLYVGSAGMEAKIAKANQFNFKQIPVGKWRNYFDLRNITDLFKTFFGLILGYFLLKKYRPDVVFAKGGYVTFPVLYWVKKMHIPLVIHESDVVPGRANSWAGSFAKKICVGFPLNNYHNFFNDKLIYTGTPTRSVFFEKKQNLNLKPIILVTGGSQGAKKINEEIIKIKPQLLGKYEIYHQVGETNDDKNQNENSYHQFGFNENLAELMAKADLIIARAGATTLAEIAALAKPAIIIPYPFAAHNHQLENAKLYKNAEAIELINEKELDSDLLLKKIDLLMSNKELRQKLADNLNKFAKPNSAEEVLRILIETKNTSTI